MRAVLPALVGPEDLPGAISLNSAQMNGSRVIGPIIGAAVFAEVGASWVFVINALSYLLVIWSLLSVRLPAAGSGHQRPAGHASAAVRVPSRAGQPRRRPVPHHHLHAVAAVAPLHRPDAHPGRPEPRHRGQEHAVRAALCLLRRRRPPRARSPSERCSPTASSSGWCAWACSCSPVFLAVFSLLRSPALAYPAILLVGLAYFAVITSLVHRAAATPRRRQPGPGHGALDHGLRRHGPHRQPDRRPDHRGHLRDPGRLRRSHRRRRPGGLRRPRTDGSTPADDPAVAPAD